MNPPTDPGIFHITHVDNLLGILREGGLWCDAQRIARGLQNKNIGYCHIKQRRLQRLVTAGVGGTLGDYVPFNFCPRSVMLYVVCKGHQDYAGGQEDIVHLVSTVSRATALGRPWVFTDRHAELGHALHFDDLAKLGDVPWQVMSRTYWQDVREERQAEFLVHEYFPWVAVCGLGVMSAVAAARVQSVISQTAHQPQVTIRPDWYY